MELVSHKDKCITWCHRRINKLFKINVKISNLECAKFYNRNTEILKHFLVITSKKKHKHSAAATLL